MMEGENASDPKIAAAYPPIPRAIAGSLGWTGTKYTLLDWIEKVIDGGGLTACAITVFITRTFALHLRDHRRAMENRRNETIKEE